MKERTSKQRIKKRKKSKIRNCPTEQTLACWAQGLLSTEIAAEISAHVERCSSCRRPAEVIVLFYEPMSP